MKKIFFLMLIALVSSCSENTTQGVSPETTQTQAEIDQVVAPDPVEQEVSLDSVFDGVASKFSENQNFNKCMQRSVDLCIQESSYDSEIEISCDDFLLEDNKLSCIATQKTQQAKESQDVSACDDLDTNKESCRFEVLVAVGLDSFDVSLCDELDESYKNICVSQIVLADAKEKKDIEICNTITLGSEIDFCIQEVEFQIENDRMEQEQKLEEERMQDEISASLELESSAQAESIEEEDSSQDE